MADATHTWKTPAKTVITDHERAVDKAIEERDMNGVYGLTSTPADNSADIAAKVRKDLKPPLEWKDSAFFEKVDAVFNEASDLLLSKHKDYGSKNISEAPGGALNGLVVRMHDKMARLKNLHEQGEVPNHESLRDTLIDLANYALIGVLVLDDEWPT